MRHKQTGSTHVIIITLVSFVILGALGYVFWQKYTSKPQTTAYTNNTNTSKTSQQPTSDLIDYGQYGVAVDSKTPTDINKLKGAPADFVAFIKHDVYEIDRSDAPADCSYSANVEKIYKQTFATGVSGGCVGNAHVIWAKVGSNWAVIAGTQVEHFSCSDLEKYAVPSTIAGTTCNITAADGSISGTKNYTQS